MKAKPWPPKDDLKKVIALIDDNWIEVSQSYNYVGGKPTESWAYGCLPIRLQSHGCGCCGDTDPAPTHWIPMPELLA